MGDLRKCRLDSAKMARLFQRIVRDLPPSAECRPDAVSVAERLARYGGERACPTCGSSYYEYEEASNK